MKITVSLEIAVENRRGNESDDQKKLYYCVRLVVLLMGFGLFLYLGVVGCNLWIGEFFFSVDACFGFFCLV